MLGNVRHSAKHCRDSILTFLSTEEIGPCEADLVDVEKVEARLLVSPLPVPILETAYPRSDTVVASGQLSRV